MIIQYLLYHNTIITATYAPVKGPFFFFKFFCKRKQSVFPVAWYTWFKGQRSAGAAAQPVLLFTACRQFHTDSVPARQSPWMLDALYQTCVPTGATTFPLGFVFRVVTPKKYSCPASNPRVLPVAPRTHRVPYSWQFLLFLTSSVWRYPFLCRELTCFYDKQWWATGTRVLRFAFWRKLKTGFRKVKVANMIYQNGTEVGLHQAR